jgi:predicted Zn-dependent peptidase
MIAFNRFRLDNGLTVIHHLDTTTPMAAVNVLYDVGARDESEDRTGFAHLFEHLMFGGSVNIPDFDAPLQFAGGESNAFTSKRRCGLKATACCRWPSPRKASRFSATSSSKNLSSAT